MSGGYVGILLGLGDLRHVGGVLRRRRAADADVFALARERRGHSRGVGAHRARRAPADERPGLVDLGWQVWPLLVFATLGPLVLTNVFWFRSISRIGPARATLAANLQPFVAAVLAVILLSEPLGLLQVLGGVLIARGHLLARRRPSPARAT